MGLGVWIGVALLAANLVVLALAVAAARRNQRVPPAHPRRVNGHGGRR